MKIHADHCFPVCFASPGKTIRVPFVNAGTEEHYLHLHDHDIRGVNNNGLYPGQIKDTGQWQLVGKVLIRLGEDFDLVTQVEYRHQTGDPAGLYGQDEVRFQVGFAYSLTSTWNEFFDDRNFLLSLEHNYIS